MILTLGQRIEAATSRGRVTFVGSAGPGGSDPAVSVPWAQLHEEARAMAAGLQARGVVPGDRVALLGPTSRPLVTAVQATWLAGAAAVVLPLPMRLGGLEDFVAQTRSRLAGADARICLVDPSLAELVPPLAGDPPLVSLGRLGSGLGGPGRPAAGAVLSQAGARQTEAFSPPVPDPSALALIQFTSGSTAEPKGVMLPHAQVGANVDAIAAGIALDPDADVAVSWLPLYHDMGLIGMLTVPMCTGTDLVLGAPQDFMGDPSRWVEWMSAYRGTCTAGPNFAYSLAARAMGRMEDIDLSAWRMALNGAEPIDPAGIDGFCLAGRRHGLDARAVLCAFGMAEATLAVTFPEIFTGMATDAVDRVALEQEQAAVPSVPGDAGTRRLARLGRPIGDLEVRVVDPEAGPEGVAGPRLRGEREVGALEIRGSSVTPGYYRDPDATLEALTPDGWLRTGDLAYLAEGELVVCGRAKDVIIVGGRNVYPEDVERAVAAVPGVRAGNVVAFGVEGSRGRENLVVVAEIRDTSATLRQAVAERVRHSVGLTAHDVVLVGPGSLPKTSSGKLQRSLCRQRYLGAELQPA